MLGEVLTTKEDLKMEESEKDECDTAAEENELLNTLTADFDEKLRLLLDPHYVSSPGGSPSSTVSKSSSTGQRKASDSAVMDLERKSNEERVRSVSLGPTQQKLLSKETTNNSKNPNSSPNRKSDLKRGRFVDKNKEPAIRPVKRNDSLTKKEKQTVNIRKKKGGGIEEKENMIGTGDEAAKAKMMKTIANQKSKIRRRHTVGGTKDFAEWERIMEEATAANAENNWNKVRTP